MIQKNSITKLRKCYDDPCVVTGILQTSQRRRSRATAVKYKEVRQHNCLHLTKATSNSIREHAQDSASASVRVYRRVQCVRMCVLTCPECQHVCLYCVLFIRYSIVYSILFAAPTLIKIYLKYIQCISTEQKKKTLCYGKPAKTLHKYLKMCYF